MITNFICGSFIINANRAFLNGADVIRENKNDISMPKHFETSDNIYPYVSAQSFRSFWKKSYIHEMSYNNQDGKLENENPLINPLDDVFGYFESNIENIVTEENKSNYSLIRSSPFQISQLHPIKGNSYYSNLNTEKGFVHLDDNTPLPYSSKFYSNNLESIFAIDLSRLGLYRNLNDRIEISKKIADDYIEKELLDLIENEKYELKDNIRQKKERVGLLLHSLLKINGGAKSAQFGTDIVPKTILLAGQEGCNPILSRLVISGPNGPILNTEGLIESLNIHRNLFSTPIYLGIRDSFIYNLKELFENIKIFNETSSIEIIVTSPVKAINRILGEL